MLDEYKHSYQSSTKSVVYSQKMSWIKCVYTVLNFSFNPIIAYTTNISGRKKVNLPMKYFKWNKIFVLIKSSHKCICIMKHKI